MARKFSFLNRNTLLISLFSAALVIGGSVYFYINQTQRVEASLEILPVTETISRELPAEFVEFSIEFNEKSTSEQQVFNRILAETEDVLEILGKNGVLPNEYTISHDLIPPSGDEEKFEMIQTIHVKSATISSAEKVDQALKKRKGTDVVNLAYGIPDARLVRYELTNETLEKVKQTAADTARSQNAKVLSILSINGQENVANFNRKPLHLEDSNKRVPLLSPMSGTDDKELSFESDIPLSATVSAEFQIQPN